VKLVAFEPASEITQHGSRGATIVGVARASGDVGIALLRLDAGGVLGRHPAVGPQLFLVVVGEGQVQGGEGERHAIAAGTAAFWEDGELHETTTETGLTALIVEGESLELT
jgi:hypothetical protein